ncbi:MAG: hypothetical protein M3O28_05655 [Actinomycetota bacterium]|nr:hypothetical protein [Actinomycetota bacterium]
MSESRLVAVPVAMPWRIWVCSNMLVEDQFIFEESHEYKAVTSVRGLLDAMARSSTMAAVEV